MPFFKRINDNSLADLINVVAPGYTLLDLEKDSYSYPFDNWYWFAHRQEADLRIPLIDQVPLENKVSMRQARLALLDLGILPTVTNFIMSMEGLAGERARVEWEFADFVEKDSPLVQMLIYVLGKTQAEIDDMFIYALTL